MSRDFKQPIKMQPFQRMFASRFPLYHHSVGLIHITAMAKNTPFTVPHCSIKRLWLL